jgi:hypothetical protein
VRWLEATWRLELEPWRQTVGLSSVMTAESVRTPDSGAWTGGAAAAPAAPNPPGHPAHHHGTTAGPVARCGRSRDATAESRGLGA